MLLGFGRSLAVKCICMNSQPCMVTPTFIDLNPNELHHYPFMINLGRCDGSCDTAENPFGAICVPNKLNNINLKVFNIIRGINELKTLIKLIPCECKCNFNDKKCNS